MLINNYLIKVTDLIQSTTNTYCGPLKVYLVGPLQGVSLGVSCWSLPSVSCSGPFQVYLGYLVLKVYLVGPFQGVSCWSLSRCILLVPLKVFLVDPFKILYLWRTTCSTWISTFAIVWASFTSKAVN